MVFTVFRGESERTGGRRFVIRNLHVRIHLPVSRLFPDLLRTRVAGGSCSAILVAILEFLRADFEGFGASKEPLDLPSRAA